MPNITRLEVGFEDAMALLDRIQKLVNENEDHISNINTTIEAVKLNQSLTEELIQKEVIERIQRIRFNIERGREKIRDYPSSAALYNATTSIELKVPEAAYGPSMQTRISFDVATDQNDALLLFLGNANEYLAFQANGGKLQIVARDGNVQTLVDTNLDIKKGDSDWKEVEFVK